MGQREAAERSLQIAEQALDPSTDHITKTSYKERDQLPDSDRMKLRGRSATIRAVMGWYQGDVPGIIKHSTQALEYLPKQDSWRGPAADVLGSAHGFSLRRRYYSGPGGLL